MQCPQDFGGLNRPDDMRMLNVAFGVGVLLALAGSTAAKGCNAPQQLVSDLVQRMVDSIKVAEMPNPSILLAWNLVGATRNYTYMWLLQRIKEEAVTRAQKDMKSGKVALYVLSLLSSCQDPRHVQALGKTIDLVQVLQQKTDEEVANLVVDGIPKTTLYSVSLDALALCLARAGGYQVASLLLAKQVLSPDSNLCVDTRAMAALAMMCTYGQTDLQDLQDELWKALHNVTNGFLNEQEKNDGMIGNIYSMGLALQTLESTHDFYVPRKWNSAQACDVVYRHHYHQPMAIAQVLPPLVDRSYLDVTDLNCTTNIMVHYTITNTLQEAHFNYNISVHVPVGSVLLKVLQKAEEEEPNTFSFQTEQTSWGPMVISIHGLAANENRRTYWEFLSSGVPLQQGVATYKPQDGEHIQANFTTYPSHGGTTMEGIKSYL